MAIEPNGTAPYAPPKAVIGIITTYRDRDMRKPFDLQVLQQAGVSESLAPRTLQALRLLDIVDKNGNPTDQFEALVRAPEEEFKQGLADLLSAAYSDIFSFADPATNDISRIRDAFRPYKPRGQQERMITLFVNLLEFAGVDVSAVKASMKTKPERSLTPRKPTPPKPRKPKPDDKPEDKGGSRGGGSPAPQRGTGVLGISPDDLALLDDDEFDEVWSALGRLAKAKARAIRGKGSSGSTEDATDNGGQT